MSNRSFKVKIRNLSKINISRLYYLTSISKNLYNQANYLIKQYHRYTSSHLGYDSLYSSIKERKNLDNTINFELLKAGVSQKIIKQLDTNWISFYKAIKDWKIHPEKYLNKPEPPKYLKEDVIHHNLIYDYQRFQIKDTQAQLEKGLLINIPKQIRNRRIKQIEVIPRYDYFEAVFVYEDEVEYKQIEKNDNVLGIDLGLNNIAACTSNTITPFNINGKALKSVNQFYNKQMSKAKTILKKRNDRHWSKRLQRITDKRNKQMNDLLHKTSRLITNKCVENNISKVIVGDVSKSLTNINIGKRNNQNFVNISLGQLMKKLEYKLENHNIKLSITNESYTSKCSFIDNDTLPDKHSPKTKYGFSGKRIKRGMYRSKNNIKINADTNGSYNIIRKVIPKFNINTLCNGIGVDYLCNRWLHPVKLNI